VRCGPGVAAVGASETTVVGTGNRFFSGDGGPAVRASIDQPYGLTGDRGILYLTDTFNSRVRIVRLT
jgi:hypothetical protein